METQLRGDGFIIFHCENKEEDIFMDKWFDNNVMCRSNKDEFVLLGPKSNSKVSIIFSEFLDYAEVAQ